MKTAVALQGKSILINGQPTYAGRVHEKRTIEGLLFNSRMVQAIFHDENPETATRWRYPDTGVWDPDRNTNEFCENLPKYAEHGVLGVTVGLQGGGSIYTPSVYEHYINSAFTPAGDLKAPFLARLLRILKAADDAGVVVIVNFFYWRQATRFEGDQAVRRATEAATRWLLETGFLNVLVDVMNECGDHWPGVPDQLRPHRIHELIDTIQQTSWNGRRLLVGCSTLGGGCLPTGKWREIEDFHMPHGNSCTPDKLRAKLRCLKESSAFQQRPRPIVVNEDSILIENLEVAVDEYASWGFYSQGFGSAYAGDQLGWAQAPRETRFDDLSGFQTVPVNWSINSPDKHPFFNRVREITGKSG